MKRTSRRLALAALLAGLLLTGCGDGTVRAGSAAVVGDTRISVDELQQVVERGLADETARQQLGADRAGYQRQVLARLVNRQVLARAADRLGIEVTAGDVDQQIEEFARQTGGRQQLEQQAEQSGISRQDLPGFVRDILLDQRIGDELTKDLDVPRAQLEQAYQSEIGRYDRVRARHILVADEAQARTALAQVRQDPSRFEDLARELSTDTGSAERGGDLGMAGRGSFVPEFEEVAFALQPGEFEVAQSEFGWHVIGVLERDLTTLQQATPELRRAVLQQQRQERTRELLSEVAAEAGVTVNPRFGEWNPETGGIEPDEAPNGVTSPAPDGSDQPGDGSLGEQPPGEGPAGEQPPAPEQEQVEPEQQQVEPAPSPAG